MNLLFLSDVYPDADHPSRGAFNFELCQALATDHNVRVIAARGWPDALKYRISGKTYRPRPHADGPDVPVMYPTYWYTPKIFRTHYGDFLWRSVQRSLDQLARTFRPDAVLSYWAHPDGEVGLRAARRFGVPAAVIVGGSDVLILPKCPTRGVRVRRVLRESDAVVTVSRGLRQAVLDQGVAPERVHAIEQGVNKFVFHGGQRAAARARLAENRRKLQEARPLLLWVGRMVEVKRLDVLIDAADELRRRGRDFVLCLAGDGPLRERITKLVRERGLDDRVEFVGSVPPESLGDWYRAADVTVLTSDSEGLPNVLRESLACGTPFVSTNVGSVNEIADERLSVIVPPREAVAFADAVERVLDGTHQEAARRYVPRTWDETAADITTALRSCGAGRRPQASCMKGELHHVS